MPRRSLRIDGKTTSIHLEDAFWEQIEHLSDEQGISWSEYCRGIVEGLDKESNRSAAVKQRLLEIAQTSVPKSVVSAWHVFDGADHFDFKFSQQIITLGRSRKCDIQLQSSRSSRVHAALIRIESSWWIVDLKSHNGVSVNGRVITRHRIKRGDRIRIGSCDISVRRERAKRSEELRK